MKFRATLLATLVCLIAIAFFARASAAKTLLVDVNMVACPTAAYTSIQAAVNGASSGDTIRICPGVYVEQVSIDKSLTLTAESGAILMPSSLQANSTSLYDGSPLAVALLVTNTTGVTISGLIVDGTNNAISECPPPDLFGIAFQNASGTIAHSTVRNFKLTAAYNGCQSGTGILVQSGGGLSSKVTIETSSIHDFQKNGITADEVGTSVVINSNTVTGVGPTTGAAQNGIQIGYGATGSITNNTVTNNVWSPCTAVATCTAFATNILVYQSDNITLTNNVVSVSQVGIFVAANNATLTGNRSSANSVFDGIHFEGTSNSVKSSTVVNSSESGIYVDGNNNTIQNNTIIEAGVGILVTTGSTGYLISGNSIFDCPTTIQDPKVRNIAQLLKPQR